MARVGNEPLPYPEKATVLGPAQVMPHEMSGTTVRVIDVPMGPFSEMNGLIKFGSKALSDRVRALLGANKEVSILDMIWDDLFARNGNEIVAYRNDRRLIKAYEEVALEDTPEGLVRFKEGGIYLVTGGLGDLASACAEELARQFKVKLSLVGRLELPHRSQWPDYLAAYGNTDRIGMAIGAIKRIEEAGAEVLYTPADVTNPQSMSQVIAKTKERFGALNGVLHTAGVIKDDLIQMKSSSDIEDVFAPKVLGTMVLDDVLADEPLDFFVLFSSTSTDTAPAGQVDYVAANAYLNAYANSRPRGEGPHTLAVHWGVWNEVGLAARAIKAAEHDEMPAMVVEPAIEPLFDRRLRDESAGDWLELRAEPSRLWLLDEHRLKTGEAIWPGTGYLELIGEATREHGILGAFEVEDLTFLRPLHVKDDEKRAVRVSLRRDKSNFLAIVESKVETETGFAWLRHAEAKLCVIRSLAPRSIDIENLKDQCAVKSIYDGGKAMRSAQEDHLNFGNRWQVLRAIHMGEGMALAKLQLSDQFSGDVDKYLIHPALMDIATGFAMDLIEGYDAKDGLWVPMSYGKVRVYRPLCTHIWSKAILNKENALGPGYATFDVLIMDERGRVLIEVEGFTVKQLPSNTDFGASLNNLSDAKIESHSKGSSGQELSPVLARLAAQVEQGICPDEGFEALKRVLGTGLPEVIVSSLDLDQLQKTISNSETEPLETASFERPNIDSEFVEPRNEIEQTLAGFWAELLGIQKIGVDDNFFDLGGHSLIAVRLFRMIKKTYQVDFPISVLFEAPTIAQVGELIESSGVAAQEDALPAGNDTSNTKAGPRLTHLVMMHEGREQGRTPLFVCAGMFGNILNLRHLAVQIGQDRPVYGLQARGLYGGQAPHETFQEMARDNLAEVRTVQPHGPYLLSGFSGGGLVAYEMAQQLMEAGEVVAMIVLLDTPYPEEPDLKIPDLISMKVQDVRREGGAYFGRWVKQRIAWELQKLSKDHHTDTSTPEHFQNEAIEAAFRRALSHYQAKSYGAPVQLIRPKLQIAYRLRGGLLLNGDRCILKADNGWSPYVANLKIVEVPGDHDSMVLEPNVRVLAGHMRSILKEAESAAQAVLMAAE